MINLLGTALFRICLCSINTICGSRSRSKRCSMFFLHVGTEMINLKKRLGGKHYRAIRETNTWKKIYSTFEFMNNHTNYDNPSLRLIPFLRVPSKFPGFQADMAI